MDISESAFSTPDVIEPREFGLKPEFIRVAWLGFVAIILLIAAAQMDINESNDDFDLCRTVGGWADRASSILVGLVPASAAVLMAHRWRLRLDARGLHRRRFFRWQTWPWEDFREGRIRRDEWAFTFLNPADHWWQQRISFSFLKEEERDYGLAVCLRFWTTPAVDMPSTLSIRLPKIGIRRMTIDMGSAGIDISGAGVLRSYGWGDVLCLRIVRLAENHPAFKILRLTLPDRELELRFSLEPGHITKNWTGASPNVVSAFLKRHISLERTEESVLEGQARTVADVDSRLEDLRNRQREFKMMVVLGITAWIIMLGWTVLDLIGFLREHPNKSLADYTVDPEVRGTLVLLCFYFVIAAVILFYEKKKRRRLELERDQLAAKALEQ